MVDLANPEKFFALSRRLTPVMAALAVILFAAGLWYGLVASPADYQQGDSVRIMYVHVPAAWMALFCYTMMAFSSAAGFIWKHPLADISAKAAAPVGLVFTGLALGTGMIWGKPIWNTWWAWDARLTSVLVLFFLYAGYMALWEAIEDKARAAKLCAIMCIIGFINVPIIKFSVDWWYSLHQPASVFRAGGPSIDPSMLTPLFLMALAYQFLFFALLLIAIRNEWMRRRIARLERLEMRVMSELVAQ